jgi:transposase
MVEEVREKYATGEYTQSKLAKMYGVSEPTISRWVKKGLVPKDEVRRKRNRFLYMPIKAIPRQYF